MLRDIIVTVSEWVNSFQLDNPPAVGLVGRHAPTAFTVVYAQRWGISGARLFARRLDALVKTVEKP
jgi:hypothetical protein